LDTVRAETPIEFAAWLRRVVENDINQLLRKYGRAERDIKLEGPLHDAAGALLPIPGDDSSPSVRASRAEVELRLEKALKEFPAEDRRIYELRTREDLSWPEIAAACGKSVEAVRKRFERMVKQLAAVLKPKDKET
jgi:RNA polymerase sigma factor (sigma-70 family)